MYNNLVIFYTSFFQFVIIPFTIYANYKQLALINKNKSNGSFSKMFCIFFIYSCFFNILYYFKHKYDLVFLIRDVFFLIFQILILLYYFENKKNEDLDFLRKEFKKEEKIKNDKVNEKNIFPKKLLGNENKKDNFEDKIILEKNNEKKLKLSKDGKSISKFIKDNDKKKNFVQNKEDKLKKIKIENFSEIKKNEVELEKKEKKFVEKLVKIEKIIIEKLTIKISVSNYSKNEKLQINTKQKKKSNSKMEEKIQKIKNKIKFEKLFFFSSTGSFFLMYTIIFISTNNFYFIEMTGFLSMIESLTGFVQILKINKKKNLKSISLILIFELFFEDLIEGIYYFFNFNPIWFQIENFIIFLSHVFLIFQILYFGFYLKKNQKKEVFVEEIDKDLEKGLDRDFN